MFKTLLALLVLMLTGCGLPSTSSSLQSNNLSVLVDKKDNVIELEGFIAGGSYSHLKGEAVTSALSNCNDVYVKMLRSFDSFRVVKTRSYEMCTNPVNENPFKDDLGYLFVYRPKIKYIVDPEDVVIMQEGPEISGIEAPQYMLWKAYDSFQAQCFATLKSLKETYNVAMIAGSCGDATTAIRMVYSPDHQKELPSIKISSRVRLYLRKGIEPMAPKAIRLVSKTGITLPDVAQAIVPSGMRKSEAIISTFRGSLTKVNLEKGVKIWEKNLTNPSPTNVRETTSLDAVAVTSDSTWIAVGGSYGYLAIVDGQTGHKIRMLSCDPRMFAPVQYEALAFSDANRSLYSVAALSSYPLSDQTYNKMNFAEMSDSKTYQHEIKRWNTKNGTLVWSAQFKADRVLSIGPSKDRSMILVVAKDRIKVLSAQTGQDVKEYLLSVYEGPIAGSFISGATFSEDGRLLAIASFSGIALIETQTQRMITRFRAPLKFELGKPEFITSKNRLRAFDAHGHVYEWDTLTSALVSMSVGEESFSLNYNGPPQMPVLSLGDGDFLVQTSSFFAEGASIKIPRVEPGNPYAKLCLTGPEADLPDPGIRSLGRLNIWNTQ